MPSNRTLTPHDKYNAPFPTNLRALMQGKGVTQDSLAAHLGVRRQTVGRYLDGSSSPPYDALCKIATYLDVSVDYLLGLTEEPSPNVNHRAVHEAFGITSGELDTIGALSDTQKTAFHELLGSPRFLPLLDRLYWCTAVFDASRDLALQVEHTMGAYPSAELDGRVLRYIPDEADRVRVAIQNQQYASLAEMISGYEVDITENAIFRLQRVAADIGRDLIGQAKHIAESKTTTVAEDAVALLRRAIQKED